MTSHSRTKGKARKSAASSARKPAQSQRVEDQYTISVDDIQKAVTAAVDTLPGEGTLPADFTERFIAGQHPGMSVEASRAEQCAAHLASSIITAMRPFLG